MDTRTWWDVSVQLPARHICVSGCYFDSTTRRGGTPESHSTNPYRSLRTAQGSAANKPSRRGSAAQAAVVETLQSRMAAPPAVPRGCTRGMTALEVCLLAQQRLLRAARARHLQHAASRAGMRDVSRWRASKLQSIIPRTRADAGPLVPVLDLQTRENRKLESVRKSSAFSGLFCTFSASESPRTHAHARMEAADVNQNAFGAGTRLLPSRQSRPCEVRGSSQVRRRAEPMRNPDARWGRPGCCCWRGYSARLFSHGRTVYGNARVVRLCGAGRSAMSADANDSCF